MGVPEQIEDEEHEQRLDRVAAIDVAKTSGKVCPGCFHDLGPDFHASRVNTDRKNP